MPLKATKELLERSIVTVLPVVAVPVKLPTPKISAMYLYVPAFKLITTFPSAPAKGLPKRVWRSSDFLTSIKPFMEAVPPVNANVISARVPESKFKVLLAPETTAVSLNSPNAGSKIPTLYVPSGTFASYAPVESVLTPR